MNAREPRRKEINLVKSLDDNQSVRETFQGIETNEGWQLRNVPGIIQDISFGDVFQEKTEGKRVWKLIKKSPYSTVIVIVREHMRTNHGMQIIRETLHPIFELNDVIFEESPPIMRFAVLPHDVDTVARTLNEGENIRKFWEWAVLSDRSSIAYIV